MPYLDQLRSALGEAAANRTDEDLLRLVSDATGRPVTQVANEYGYDPGKGSMWGERMSASIDRYQAGLYDAASHAAGALGLNNWSGLLDERRRANTVQADVASGRAANLGAVDRWSDVHSVGDFGNWAGGLAVGSLPYMGEALVGGMAGRAIIGGGQALRGVAGGLGATAASLPSSTGQILDAQRDQSGTTDFGTAVTLAPLYSGVNMLGGVEGTLARGQLARSGVSALDNLTGAGGVAARTAASVGRSALTEGATEVGQEFISQIGRNAVDDAGFFGPEAMDRYGESLAGGAVLGGMFGGAAGGWRRSEGYRPTLEETGNLLDPSNPVTTVPQGPTPPPPGSMPGVPLTGIAPEVVAPPLAPVEPNIVAGVDANTTQAEVQRKVQERQTATAELAQLIGAEKPKGAQVNLYLEMRGLRGVQGGFSDQEFQDAVVQLGAGEYPAVRAAIKARQGAIKGEKEIADGSGGAAAGTQPGGSGAGGGADVGAGVGSAGQLDGASASIPVLAPAAPGATSLPARVGAVQQPAGVAPSAPLTKAAPEGAAPKVTTKPKREIVKPAPVNTPGELKTRIASLDGRDKGILLDALGADEELNQVNKPLTLRELGKKYGVSHEGARKIIGRQGIGQSAISKFAGVDMDAFGSSRELAGDNATSDNMGFRETRSLAGSGIKDTGQTAASRRLEKEANALLKAAKTTAPAAQGPDPKLAVPGSRTEAYLLKKQQEREAAKKAADEALEKRRQEYAARLKADAERVNKDLEPGPAEPLEDFEVADREGAERDWEESRQKADAHWSDLTKEEKDAYTALWRSNDRGKLGERGRDYLDDLYDRTEKAARSRVQAQPKAEEPPVVGDGSKSQATVVVKKKRTVVSPDAQASVDDSARQDRLVREAANRARAKMHGNGFGEVPQNKRIHVRSRLNKILKEFDAGKYPPEGLANRVEELSDELEVAAMEKHFTAKGGRERGADYIRERLLQAKRRGDLSEKQVELAEWFVLQNPELLDDLGISVRANKHDGISGLYRPVERVIELAKGSLQTDVAVHEMLHHMERMMPKALQAEIRKMWAKAVATEVKKAQKSGDTNRAAFMERVLRASVEKDPRSHELAMKDVVEGRVAKEDYAYMDPSEFWAVNMAAREEWRFDARNSFWDKVEIWLDDAIEWIKMVLGLNSRTPMIRALRAIRAGNGEFESPMMLSQRTVQNAVERSDDGNLDQPPGGKPGSANPRAADAPVQRSLQPRAADAALPDSRRIQSQSAGGAGAGQPPSGSQSGGLGDLPPPPGRPAKLKGWIDSVVAGKWRAAPWLLGTLSTEQLAERFKDLPGNGGKALRAFHQGMQRMAQRANSLITDSDRIKRQWETLRSRHGDKADEAFTDFLLESTRMRIWGMHPLDTDYEAEDNPNRHLAKVKKLEDGTKVLEYDADTRTRHAQLAQQWRGLNADYQKFFETLQADFQKKYEAKVEGFRQNIVAGHYLPDGAAMGHDVVDRAAKLEKKDRAAFASQHAKSKIERDTLRSLWADLDEHASEFPKEMKGPYFPLMRFGEHIVSVKSQGYRNAEAKLVEENAALEALLNAPVSGRVAELEERLETYRQELPKAKSEEERNTLAMKIVSAEAELDKAREPIKEARKKRNAAKKELARLKGSENDYVVEFYETLGEAKARYDQLSAHYANQEDVQVEQKLKDRYLREVDGVTPTFLKKVEDNLAAELPASERNAVKQTMREMYLQMLPETSAMKSQMKRKNVAGVRADQGLRSFSASSVRDAWYISRLENREPVRAALNELRFSDDVDTKLIGNELAMRVAQNWHFDNRQWMGAVTNVTYMAYLGMSPAFIVTQITQPWVISAPVMAARHGASTAGQLWRGWKQAGQLMQLNKKAEGTINYTLDPAAGLKAGILTEGEAGMLKEMLDSGRIDITITHDLGAAAAGRSEGLLGKAVRLSAIPAQQAEILNRVSTALAAYRMEKARLMGEGKGDADATRAARDYADRIVAETHLNYAPENRARLMHPNSFGGWGRIMWQFRSYQQGMLYLTLKNLFDAVKGDKEARRAVVYLAGMQLAVAGTSGLPIAFPAGLVATLIYKMLTDDDEEKDLKELYRQTIADIAGDTAATLVTKGAPAAFLGVDMSRRIGMGNIFNPVPYADDRAEGRDWVAAHWLALAGGAPLGYAGNVAEGLKAASEGDFAKAFAWAVPWKVAADLARGGSQAVRGMVDSRGNTIMAPEELGYEDAVLKMLGFPVQSVERVREQRNAFFEARQNRDDGRTALMRELVRARLDGEALDTQAMQEFNQRHPDQRITYSDIIQQAKAKRKEAAVMQRTGGIPLKKSDRALASELGIE